MHTTHGWHQERPKILIVDDEPTNLKVLKQILQDDYHLLFAKSGEEALALASREQPGLILLDVMMPGMTGFGACQRLKRETDTARIPVIFVTAWTKPPALRSAASTTSANLSCLRL